MNNVVSFSGGKDSTALILGMLERGEYIHSAVFFDTGWEFPEMLEHIDKFEAYTGVNIVRLKPEMPFTHRMFERPIVAKRHFLEKKHISELRKTFEFVVRYYGIEQDMPETREGLIEAIDGKVHRIGNGWPSPGRRWCTREKVKTINIYLKSVSDPVSCIGYAADEAHRSDSKNVVDSIARGKKIRFPLIEWDMTEAQALAYCRKHGFDWGGLYDHFSRVSCFCCPLQQLRDLRKLRKFYPDLWRKMLEWDAAVPGHNRGFRDYDTVRDLESRFSQEPSLMDYLEKLQAESAASDHVQ